MKPLYFDYMATTPLDPHVLEVMLYYMGLEGHFGNASSKHAYGKVAACAIAKARGQVASVIGANPEGLVWTSGATESNNLALLGAAHFYKRQGQHVVTMATEHRAVLDACAQLARLGFEITYLKPKADGLLALDELERSLRSDTILVSVMQVNNETGVVQNIEQIGALLKNRGILFHVDAAQSVGRVAVDVASSNVDLMSLSAHKSYGPQGVGALYVRQKPRIRLQPQLFGGGQQMGLRSGTLPVHQIVGMGEAFELAQSLYKEESARILSLRNALWAGICDLPGVVLNGSVSERVAGTLNVCFQGMSGVALMEACPDLAMSATAACSASSLAPSHVLRAMGFSDTWAKSSVRLSLGRFTTQEEVNQAKTILRGVFKDD